jgi:putative metalloprotease
MKKLLRLPLILALVAAIGFAPDSFAQQARRSVDSAQAQRLQTIMIPLIQRMNNPIALHNVRVQVMADNSINAGNAGGGNFMVTTGLLNKASDEQLRAIMAHEVAHADLGHVAKQQRVNTGIGIGIALLDQIWPGASAITPIAGKLLSNAYSRGEEREADAHGVEIMRRAGHDGKTSMVNTLTWLARTQGNSGGFFATHPTTGDRIAAVQQMQ